jgi:subfamily B ATP-binding cassette protein MsbA
MEDFRKIILLVKPYAGRLLLAGVCSLVVSGMNGSLAWLVKPAVDKVFVEKNAASLMLLSIAIMGTFFGRGVFEFFQSYLMISTGAKVVRDIRDKLYHHMLYLPMSFINKDSTGAMVSRVLNDAGAVQGLLAFTVKDLFVESMTVIVLICVAMTRRWDLTLISLIVLPVAFYFVGKFGKRLRRVSGRAQQKVALLTETLTESFMGNKMIKSFCREEDEMVRFRDRNQDFYRELMRSTRITEASSLMMEFVGGVGIGFVVWYGGSLVIQGAMTPGDFFSFLAAIFMIYTPAKRLAAAQNSLQQARAPLERIDKVLEQGKEAEGPVVVESFDREMTFDNISFRYSGTDDDAINGLSLTVKRGEIIALVGSSGAGKTTLVDLIPKFYTPSEGTISLDGLDISTVTLKSLRSLIGLVSQDIVLFNDTIKANIGYGKPNASAKEIVNAAQAAYAHEFILQLSDGYNTVIGERGVRLSGGQKQRLSIARAILKNPPILILDEATSSLDTASEMMVQRALENLMHDRTAFVIAHRLSTVRRASRIIVLDKGKIAESGTHEELLAFHGVYEKLYTMQFADTTAEKIMNDSATTPERPA